MKIEITIRIDERRQERRPYGNNIAIARFEKASGAGPSVDLGGPPKEASRTVHRRIGKSADVMPEEES
jgi:hypothetical protein